MQIISGNTIFDKSTILTTGGSVILQAGQYPKGLQIPVAFWNIYRKIAVYLIKLYTNLSLKAIGKIVWYELYNRVNDGREIQGESIKR